MNLEILAAETQSTLATLAKVAELVSANDLHLRYVSVSSPCFEHNCDQAPCVTIRTKTAPKQFARWAEFLDAPITISVKSIEDGARTEINLEIRVVRHEIDWSVRCLLWRNEKPLPEFPDGSMTAVEFRAANDAAQARHHAEDAAKEAAPETGL